MGFAMQVESSLSNNCDPKRRGKESRFLFVCGLKRKAMGKEVRGGRIKGGLARLGDGQHLYGCFGAHVDVRNVLTAGEEATGVRRTLWSVAHDLTFDIGIGDSHSARLESPIMSKVQDKDKPLLF
jgi:hypothetical protein